MNILKWNLTLLHNKAMEMTGPVSPLYLRALTELLVLNNGVCLASIQALDNRAFFVSNPRFKSFPPVCYNPIILTADDPIKEKEGCLSFPGMWITVTRYKYITLKYRDSNWKEITVSLGAEDANTEEALLCKAVQHEVAHLQGICLHERASNDKMKTKHLTHILRESMAQNKKYGIPKLIEGPPCLDPSNLPIMEPFNEVKDNKDKSVGTI